jgi:acyl-CoA synthetase (AMP-forming)/AMP-acid ligase II
MQIALAHTDFLLEVFSQHRTLDAIVWRDAVYSYDWLLRETERWRKKLERELPRGAVVSVEADFSPTAVALLLALIDHDAIMVPLTSSVATKMAEFREIAEVEARIAIGEGDGVSIENTGVVARHDILRRIKREHRPGLVLFSSGSTGKSKAAVHDLLPMLDKFKVRRHTMRAIAFLLFDHIGGFNTLLYTLSNAGCVVTVRNRSPEVVCEAVQKYRVELVPTTPTFLNLMIVSEAYKKHDLSSLKTVTYGTEVMPESTLKRFHRLFPNIQLLQTYGLSEVGILRSKSRSSDSLWVKVGGEGFETRIVDGLLEIKAKSAMLGYLNAPSPFTADGWFKTGDAVVVDGEWIRILGRKSEIINVGGEKVYPAEVESMLQMMDGVESVVVSGEPHALTGQIVRAKVKLTTGESLADFRKRMRAFCADKLPRHMIPHKVILAEASMHGERFKKMRNM